MRRHRTLRSRLFLWFVGAILLAMATSALVVVTTRPDPVTGVETVARNVSSHLALVWGDADATRAYVDEVRDVTGFDVRLVRELRELPRNVRRVAERGGVIAPRGAGAHLRAQSSAGRSSSARSSSSRSGRARSPGHGGGSVSRSFSSSSCSRPWRAASPTSWPRPSSNSPAPPTASAAGDLAFRTDIARGALRWTVREVRDVAVSFNRMADRVEAMVRGQRELLGAISHELRSPLGRARVALEIARDRLPPDAPDASGRSPARALDDVDKQLGAVDGLLGDLLDVTRAGLADLRKERRPLVEWLRSRIAEEPQPPPIELSVAAGAEELAVSIDAALLARAVHNLLANARAHGHPLDAPLQVAVERRGDTARVTVRDKGPGFPEGFADKAFEPFVRGDAARARPAEGPGHGLGLAIVRRVVEAHGGRTFARNGAGGGAEVGFDLPAVPPAR